MVDRPTAFRGAAAPLRARRAVRRAALLVAALATALLARCGGGGGGGGGGAGGSAPTTGVIEGTIVLPGQDWGILAEREPNDGPAQAQLLPPLMPASTVVVAGDLGATAERYGAVDTVDAFRTSCHEEQVVTLTLDSLTDGAATAGLDLAVLDTGSGNPVVSAATPSPSEQVSFTAAADVAFDVVVTCGTGSGTYTLRIDTEDPPAAARVATTSLETVPASDGTAPSIEAIDYALVEPPVVAQRVLVRLSDAGRADVAASRVGGRVVRRTGAGSVVVEVPKRFRDAGARASLAAAAALVGRPGVRFAEPDAILHPSYVPNDPGFSRQWNLEAIGAPSAWDVTKGSPSIVVGVLDTGIVAHPDLDAQRVPGYDFVSDAGNSGDGDGRDPDPTDPGDGSMPDGTSSWHGSHVAGIVAARQDDGYGLSGVAPGCKVMPLRVTGTLGGTASDLADAIRYAAGLDPTAHGPRLAKPLRVVNISLGTSVNSQEIADACQAAADAGTLIVAAAGNDDAGPVEYPAAFPTVLAVGAVDSRLALASYSNVGSQIALVAPGGNDDRERDGDGYLDGVPSTVLDETVSPAQPGEAYYSGTSMASPHVAGVAALVLSVDPSLDRAALRTLLMDSARDLDVPGIDDLTGAGLVEAGEAVRLALVGLGTPRADGARLALSSDSLRFVASQTIQDVQVTNAGGGVLHVGGLVATTDSGFPWLSAFTTAASTGPSDTALVAVTVSRVGLAPGVYAGTVTLTDGTSALGTIRVLLEVGPTRLEGRPFSVVAIQQSTGIVRGSGIAYPIDGYRYVLTGLPPGDYTVRAGTDLDGDGFFCEAADFCGEVTTGVHVTAGTRLPGVDVTLH